MYSLTRDMKDDATGSHLRLWHYSESMLDLPGYFLEIVEEDQPVQPHIGQLIVSLDGTDTLPTLKYENGCYALVVTWVKHATRFEQNNWLLFLFFGSGVDLKSGDSWNEMIAQKPVCFRFEKLTKGATAVQP